ncbi:sensor histidine kinase [Lentzea flava]|uniref:histidine kinase n=1 Tax=Lentzea flava TaxID=103732 RepID=A0ABQ2UZ00_9PSEU|nr:sensor histidine kinase [Lentzea flava]MCP2202071.1 Histidine kinase-, DNA gyrase B-, and HSP90-like ATPase [Lentzea flava]GGU56823.1 two-component sensor histidine kinase [Lentzea flava]
MRRQFIVPAESCARSAAEARRTVLRDLHDGVGPSLAAVALGLRSARQLLTSDPAGAARMLAVLEEEMHSAIDDIRSLVASENPASVTKHGLVGAVELFVAALRSRLHVAIDVVVLGEIPALPDAVSVAAYRIIREALTNVVTHADARTCQVRLWFDAELRVEVVDDGVGAAEVSTGVGLASMRQRASDLGGECRVEPGLGGGTRLAAALPLS